jgi:GDP/UDP-N,N'-diacetylbacillosamine 2-epimerase (hydrolysing)
MSYRPKIAVFTGTRAEYGLLHASISRLAAHPDFDLQLLVGGSHLNPFYGDTIREIEADGFPIAGRFSTPYVGQNTALDAFETGRLLTMFWQQAETRPDLLLLLGDRHETFAAASAAALLSIPIAHLHGGDVTEGGLVDDALRHAITKLAHWHFPATQRSAERILQLGEAPERVYVVGAPAIENAMWVESFPRTVIARRLGLNPEKRWIVFTQHPASACLEQAEADMRSSLEALCPSACTSLPKEVEILITGTNQDTGGDVMRRVICEYAETYPSVCFVPNLGRVLMLNVMREAFLIVGNSSSGLLESVCFQKPVLNIGSRQAGRERGHNVVDVPQDTKAIEVALNRFLDDEAFYQDYAQSIHPFGDGQTSQRIITVLEAIDFRSSERCRKGFHSVFQSSHVTETSCCGAGLF